MKSDIKKLLVIAPHPDDELNLAGQLIVKAVQKGVKAYVLYTTNGDATVGEGNKRVFEAVDALYELGVGLKNIFFLGYANGWQEGEHLYHSEQPLKSALQKEYTNCPDGIKEYCYQKRKQHHVFIYKNFKDDMKEAIRDISADLIICIDFDSHPDHRAASLTFDRCMGELLKESPNYRPIVLKKYAYNGIWNGAKDYYAWPFKRTGHKAGFIYQGGRHDLESHNFCWDERVSFSVPKETTTSLLRNNVIYKAARKHKQTVAWYEMQRVINADAVYWVRPTDNLMMAADVTSTSGVPDYINDFMMYDAENVLNRSEPFGECEYCWRPDDEDDQKELRVQFKKLEIVKKICIYEDFSFNNHIKKLSVSIDGKIWFCEPNSLGLKTEIVFDDFIKTNSITFRICDAVGNGGISEIEVYSGDTSPIQESTFLEMYTEGDGATDRTRTTILTQKLENVVLIIEFALKFKIGYEIQRLFRKGGTSK